MKRTNQSLLINTVIKFIHFRFFLSVMLLLSTFYCFAQIPYPCNKDSVDMTTNNLWFSELERLLYSSTEKLIPHKQNKLEIIAHLKQRVNCDTSIIVKQTNYYCVLVRPIQKRTKDTIYSQPKPTCIPLYVVNGMFIGHRYIHLVINNLEEKQLKECYVLKNAAAAAVYGTNARDGVIILNIEPLLLQGSQIVIQKRKNKKNKLILQLQSKTKLDNVKVQIEPFMSTYFDSDTLLKPTTYNFKFRNGKNRIVLPLHIHRGLYTIYLNGAKEMVFIE